MKNVIQKKQTIGREFYEQQMTICVNCEFNSHSYLKLSELEFLHPKSKCFKGRQNFAHEKSYIVFFVFIFFVLLLLLLLLFLVPLLLPLVVGGRRAEGYE